MQVANQTLHHLPQARIRRFTESLHHGIRQAGLVEFAHPGVPTWVYGVNVPQSPPQWKRVRGVPPSGHSCAYGGRMIGTNSTQTSIATTVKGTPILMKSLKL
ncbi:hypothetical protein GCM10011320_19860 [Neoroseomonas lacus]|uniref:Uncharacterized protein n=1 Tax=Neoroseomonas lacus TaxID=287609 RepID=A0A917NMY8_9PROT|nr:hypothetical protein GCM10011320_19860 [Neoroseomonas lacus]